MFKNPEAKHRKGLIDYNCHIFQEGLNNVFERSWESKEEEGVEATHLDRKGRVAATATDTKVGADGADVEA